MGRPSLGLRVRVTARMPADTAAAAKADADRRGWDMSTWLSWAAAQALKTREPRR